MQFLEQHATPGAQMRAKGTPKRGKGPTVPAATAAMIAIRGSKIVYASMEEVMRHTDFKLRRGTDEWWSDIKRLVEVMGGRTGVLASGKKEVKV
jgi:6-phosphofructokinase 1